MTIPPEVLLAVIALIGGAFAFLGRWLLEAYRDMRAQRDIALDGWGTTVVAINRLSTAVEKLIESRT